MYIKLRNVRICREIEYLELRKLNEKFCTLYMHRMSGFVEKLNHQNYENSTGNFLHYIHTERLDL